MTLFQIKCKLVVNANLMYKCMLDQQNPTTKVAQIVVCALVGTKRILR